MNQKKKIKVLFLSAWYPNRYDAMAGLFVRKHAEAVSLYCDVTVLYVHGDKHINNFEVVNHKHGEIDEVTVYFPFKDNNLFRRSLKILNFLRAYKKGIQTLKLSVNKPDLIHVNILTRTGFIAYYMKSRYKIPYVITEHWSRYFSNRDSFQGIVRKTLTKIVVKHASAVLPVSNGLQDAMKKHKLLNHNYHVINNVVDDFFFEDRKSNKETNLKRILHISCFDEPVKNITGILRSVKSLSEIRNDFEIIIVGTGIDFKQVKLYSDKLKFPDQMIHFTGELAPVEVAEQFFNADFFVMFSNYENAPVVIAESLCCGKPVISTDVGGITEMINQSNGILITAKDEQALTNAIDYMLDYYNNYNSKEIREFAKKKYSYENVGNVIKNIYADIINNEV